MNEKNSMHETWSELPTPRLDEILQQELRKEEPSEEVVLGILAVIREREEDLSAEVTEDVSEAWERYEEKSISVKMPKRKCLWCMGAAAAAVICILILTVPRSVEAESIFGAFCRWTESVFEFFTPGEDVTKPSAEYIFQTEHPGLQQVYDQVTALGAEEPVVPMAFPKDGFVLEELKVMPMPDGNRVYADFHCDGEVIMLSYWISEDILPSEHEKENFGVEGYENSNVWHYMMDNGEGMQISWTVKGVECSVNTTLEREEAYQLIDAIYKRKLS